MTQYNVIDCHVHLRDTASADKLMAMTDAIGHARVGLLCTVSRDQVNANPFAFACKARYPDRVYLFAGLDHTAWLAGRNDRATFLARQVDELIAIGADGIKMIEGKPTTRSWLKEPVDSAYFSSYFARMEETRLPILWHVNDPEEFWDPATTPYWAKERGWGYGPEHIQKEAQYAEIDRLLLRHPKLNIIFAHFYFLSADLPRATRFLDAHPSVNFDLAPGIEYLYNLSRDPEMARDFFIKYTDRIVFGTDIMSTQTLAEASARAGIVRRWLETDDEYRVPSDADFLLGKPEDGILRGLKLPEVALDHIYKKNYERICGTRPRPINVSRAAAECHRIATLAKDPKDTLDAAAILEQSPV
ncbi:MAG: amidohydrolase family protein [Planctomycetota bacterium]